MRRLILSLAAGALVVFGQGIQPYFDPIQGKIVGGTRTFTGNVAVNAAVLNGCNGTEAAPCASNSTAGLQAQVNTFAALRGGLVQLAPSRYNITASDGIRITTQSITITGSSPGYAADPGGTAEGITGTKLYVTTRGISIGTSGSRVGGTLLRDLYFYGASTSTSYGIVMDDNVVDTNIQNLRGGGMAAGVYGPSGTLDTIRIRDCSLFGNQAGLVFVGGISYSHLDNCEISDNLGAGLYIPYDSGKTLQGNTLSNSHFVRNSTTSGKTGSGAGVVWGTTHGSVVGNVFREMGNGLLAADGLLVPGHYNAIGGNAFHYNLMGAAVRLSGSANVIGADNSFSNNLLDIAVDSTGTGNAITVGSPSTTICDLGTSTAINAPNGYTTSCPPYPVGGANPWADTRVTVTSGAADPSGYSTGVSLVPTVANNNHLITTTKGFPVVNGTFSAQMKANGYDFAYITISDGAGNFRSAYFNISSCTAGTVSSAFSASSATAGWSASWCIVSVTLPGTATQMIIGVANVDNNSNFAGDGTSGIIIWQPKIASAGVQQSSTITKVSGTGGSGADAAFCSQLVFANGQKQASCNLVNYAQTGAAQTYTYPTPFAYVPTLTITAGSCGTYNPTTTATALTLPANAAMTAENCNVVVSGQ